MGCGQNLYMWNWNCGTVNVCGSGQSIYHVYSRGCGPGDRMPLMHVAGGLDLWTVDRMSIIYVAAGVVLWTVNKMYVCSKKGRVQNMDPLCGSGTPFHGRVQFMQL